MYKYWGFGLNIQSEIEFPELLPSDFNDPGLTISIGSAPGELIGDEVVKKVRMRTSPTEYLLDVNNIAKYYAANGNRIIIEPYAAADDASIRLFMLSNAMAAILHQQNKIPFHASGVLTKEGLVLFTGRSGIGKSTTACALMQHGYQLFTDDVCVLNENGITQKVEAFSSYPMTKLWENTVDHISSTLQKNYRLRPHLPKYGFFQHDNFIQSSIPVVAVYVLKSDNLQTKYSCSQLDPVRSFNNLQQNTYRRRQVDFMKLRPSHFQIITKLANQARVFEVTRPSDGGTIATFTDFIKEQLGPHA